MKTTRELFARGLEITAHAIDRYCERCARGSRPQVEMAILRAVYAVYAGSALSKKRQRLYNISDGCVGVRGGDGNIYVVHHNENRGVVVTSIKPIRRCREFNREVSKEFETTKWNRHSKHRRDFAHA